MCGIAGFYGFRNDSLIKQFSTWLRHRGPDGDGYFMNDNVTLLNRRLAIIDIKGGDQPVYNEDKSIAVVYNGEIYNYLELRVELEKMGHIFTTKSDTEVIVHGYEEWGTDCFDRFNAMFAIALYDIKKDTLILARDHFGIKPLYYASPDKSKHIIFSSEIKPILNSGLIKAQPDDRIVYRYLKYRVHDNGRETFFNGIARLLPGEFMVVGKQGIKIKKYSKLQEELSVSVQNTASGPLVQDQVNRFKELLCDSINRRLISEVPVGTCLSGGLDSSTVVAMVNRLLEEKTGESKSVGDIQKTFSAVFPGSSNDEEKYIDSLLAMSKNIKDYKVFPKAREFFGDLSDFVKTQEEPTISTGPYAQYQVMRKAHEQVTVVLDGQGADEMMAGYLPYYFVYLRQLLNEKKFGKLISEIAASGDIITKYVIQRFTPSTNIPVHRLLNKEFGKIHKNELFTVEGSNIKKRLIEDIFENSLQSLLRYEDKNAMRFSIEGRVPFLDFRLVKMLFALPDEAIIKKGWNKFILRESTRDLLPPLINRRRNKIGFTTPEHEWFKNNSAVIMNFFTGERFESKRYVNQAEVVIAFRDFISGKTEDTMMFWRILNLELWLREFVGKPEKTVKAATAKKINNPVAVQKNKYFRYPILTGVFKKNDNAPLLIAGEIKKNISIFNGKGLKWFVVVSEKVVAVSQGRSYFIWDIKPSIWARVLSRFVSRVPWGIGLGSPWTMQLAIQEVGLPRILYATAAAAVTKPFGIRGTFYRIAGRSAAGIDGPTEYSLYPANVSAKLLPSKPSEVCKRIDKEVGRLEDLPGAYLGSSIIDANDIGRNVLGNSTGLTDREIEEIFADNPMGQTNEQTPVTIVLCQ